MNYFLQNTETGEIKIGYSYREVGRLHDLELELERAKRPGRRISANRARQLRRLAMLAYVVGDKRQERELHDLFRDHRAHGEWFRVGVLKPAIIWVYKWCEKASKLEGLSGPKRPLDQRRAYGQLWEWITVGFRTVRLQGEITYCGRRWENGRICEDVSGAKFSVPRLALEEFADQILSRSQNVR